MSLASNSDCRRTYSCDVPAEIAANAIVPPSGDSAMPGRATRFNVVFGGAPDNVMAYAQIYVMSDIARDVFIASDIAFS